MIRHLIHVFVLNTLFTLTHMLVSSDGNIQDHVLMKPDNQRLLYDIAQDFSLRLDQEFSQKQQIIWGLGQAPAYLVEMLQKIDVQKQRQNREYHHVAFSGTIFQQPTSSLQNPHNVPPDVFKDNSAFQRYWTHNGTQQKYSKTRQQLLCENREIYMQYLSETTGFKSEQQPYDNKQHIVIDRCNTGSALCSFLHLFQNCENRPAAFFLAEQRFITMKSTRAISLTHSQHALMFALSSSKTYESFNDRLIPEWYVEWWKDRNPRMFHISTNARTILAALDQYVCQRFSDASQQQVFLTTRTAPSPQFSTATLRHRPAFTWGPVRYTGSVPPKKL